MFPVSGAIWRAVRRLSAPHHGLIVLLVWLLVVLIAWEVLLVVFFYEALVVGVCALLAVRWPRAAYWRRPGRPTAVVAPGVSPAALLNAQANYTRAQTEAARSRPAWCSYCKRFSPGTAVACEHCGAGNLTYNSGL